MSKNRMAGEELNKALSENRQSFQDVHDKRAPKWQQRRADAQSSMGDGYKTDITQYNHSAAGHKKFDMSDVKHLRKSGYSDEDISKYSSNLNANQLSEDIRLNQANFAGNSYKGKMAEGSKITDHDVGRGFNMSDVKYLQSQGFSDKEISQHANSSVLEGGKRHGNAMSKYMEKHGQLNYKHGAWKNAKGKAQGQLGSGNNNTDIKDSFNTDIKDSFNNKNKQNVDGSTKQTVTQDNDQTSTINGNNNNVFQTQDNSVRNYGGDTRVFNYQGGGNSGVDTPASAATLAGYYDTNDSPAASAKFFDMHNTLFQDAQKKYSRKGKETASMYSNFDARGYDPGKLDSRIENSKLRSYDRATVAKNDLFGDQDRYRGYLSDYKFGEGPDPIEND